MKLTSKQRAELFKMFDGHCAYCGEVLPEKGWQADHIIPCERKSELVYENGRVVVENGKYKYKHTGGFWNPGANKIDNFYPSCRACNINKSCHSLESWRIWLEDRVNQLRKQEASFRHAERFGLVTPAKTKVVFYFETFQKMEEAA